MNLEIKDRIEKIRNDIVPEGYKNSKIGIIPEEWNETGLNEIGQFMKGKGISKSELIDKGLNCITYGEIYTVHNLFIKKFHSFINEQSAKNSIRIMKGDILFAGSGETAEEIGKTIAYLGKEKAYAGGDIIILRPQKNNSVFMSYFLNSDIGVSQKRKLGQGYSVVHIYSNLLKKIKIILPNNPEQSCIAAILSTWDKAIELKGKLIEQKKLQKKGLMQLLLTGKKRVINPENGKPFEGEWQEVKLFDLLIYEQPNKYIVKEVKKNEDCSTPVLTANKSFILGYTDEKENIYVNIPVIIFDDFTTDTKFVDFPFKIKSSAIKLLKPKTKNVSLKFVFEKIQIIKFAIGEHKRYYISEYQYIKIQIPKYEEQQAIASVLTTADKEIELLKNELEKFKEQKRGLMQLLLTGIVRVK